MNIMNLVVLAIVVTIFATITLASLSYAVFRLRERRSPPNHSFGEGTPQFFERVRFAPEVAGVEHTQHPATITR